jgi:hypothetical protein
MSVHLIPKPKLATPSNNNNNNNNSNNTATDTINCPVCHTIVRDNNISVNCGNHWCQQPKQHRRLFHYHCFIAHSNIQAHTPLCSCKALLPVLTISSRRFPINHGDDPLVEPVWLPATKKFQ